MRLEKLWIGKFKNLVNLTIDFSNSGSETVLIGGNATGKSNLIEALVLIFRNLDLGEKQPFAYRLSYVCRGKRIEVDATLESKIQISIDGQSTTYASLTKGAEREYLPRNVFGYYSGQSRRLEQHFERHREIFYSALLRGEEIPLRPIFYARGVHSQYVLLAFFSFKEEPPPSFLNKYLGITQFESATFFLKRPWWYKRENKGDEFWGAVGVVRVFLEHLKDIAGQPDRKIERRSAPYHRTRSEQIASFTIANVDKLRELAAKYENNVNFFKTLESTYISDLILELRIKVKKQGVDGGLEFSELSEGEQQLLTVLGLIVFTRERESLFLLDEPDTHLNPTWKLTYLDLLREVIPKDGTNHVLIVTHDPLIVGSLKKEQVRVFSLDQNKRVSVAQPIEDPMGMGVAALLIQLFNLPTTLDLATQRKLDRLTELATKEEKTTQESKELQGLNGELEGLGFLTTVRDPLYSMFIRR